MSKAYILLILSLVGCTIGVDYLIDSKNACYSFQLVSLKKTSLYKDVHTSFIKEFSKDLAARRSLLEEIADEAIFFSADSSKCILLGLQRSHSDQKGGGLFGSTRTYEGNLINQTWQFKKSMWFTFDEGYFKKYPENSFENISKVARYTVLTSGDVDFGGCSIDEGFWFE